MCTIAVLFRSHDAHPLFVAANRDEFFARQSDAPKAKAETPFIAGRDLQAGGTWLGATRRGFFVALTNQRSAPSVRPKSRGALVEAVLRSGQTDKAVSLLRKSNPEDYGECNLLFGDPSELWVAYCRHGEPMHIEALAPGIHVLANDRLGSLAFPKTARFHDRLQALPKDLPATELRRRLEILLGDTQLPADAPRSNFSPEFERQLQALCVRTPNYGTVSATVLSIGEGGLQHYRYCDGSPAEETFHTVWHSPNLSQDSAPRS